MSNQDIDILKFDLYCTDISNKPQYRLYVDEDLLVERNYLWDNNVNCVRENCELRLSPGLHKITIISENPGIFTIKNPSFNSEPLELGSDGSFVKP